MKTFSLFKSVLAFVALSVFITSCGDDTSILNTSTPPTLVVNDVLGYITGDSDVQYGGNFSVYLTGTKGSGDMKSVTVYEDGTKIDASRVTFKASGGGANPWALTGDNADEFQYDVAIDAHLSYGYKTYDFIVEDENNLTAKVSFNINVVGTSLNSLEGILLNQSGPQGQGGLDLDTGASSGTQESDPNYINAEIRDEGIVNILTDQTWKQQISGMNGSVIKYIKAGTNGISETFSFDDIKYKEQLTALWSSGVDFTQKSTDNQRFVSDVVSVGDVFIVQNGSKYYLLYTRAINVTSTDNKDSYTFDVKL